MAIMANTAHSAAVIMNAQRVNHSRDGTLMVNGPSSGTPVTAIGRMYPKHASTPAAAQTARLERYTAVLECPTAILLRMVPSLYSAPVKRLQKAESTTPDSSAKIIYRLSRRPACRTG